MNWNHFSSIIFMLGFAYVIYILIYTIRFLHTLKKFVKDVDSQIAAVCLKVIKIESWIELRESVLSLPDIKLRNDANVCDDKGMTPLHHAALQGFILDAQVLYNSGANVNAIDNIGWAPIHYAVLGGYIDVVKELIEWQAQINLITYRGCTSLDIANITGQTEISELLRSHGATEGINSLSRDVELEGIKNDFGQKA